MASSEQLALDDQTSDLPSKKRMAELLYFLE
jgi:hypothetical protein